MVKNKQSPIQKDTLNKRVGARGKTPSGSSTTLSVEDIRGFFEAKKKDERSEKSDLAELCKVTSKLVAINNNSQRSSKVAQPRFSDQGSQVRSDKQTRSAVQTPMIKEKCELAKHLNEQLRVHSDYNTDQEDLFHTPPATPLRNLKSMATREKSNSQELMQEEMDVEAQATPHRQENTDQFEMKMMHACFKRLEEKVDKIACSLGEEAKGDDFAALVEKVDNMSINDQTRDTKIKVLEGRYEQQQQRMKIMPEQCNICIR